ncbi:uncharacterized protein LOC116167480 [Photinus pyralis]|uniref:uncharacterized protein LOC116167480 n=1 Tax=Photinus pyralis TaxID=7054 RepID=UPI00126742F2|nr:uncharacterized protein LOC116167480 [Photinus pyralis]
MLVVILLLFYCSNMMVTCYIREVYQNPMFDETPKHSVQWDGRIFVVEGRICECKVQNGSVILGQATYIKIIMVIVSENEESYHELCDTGCRYLIKTEPYEAQNGLCTFLTRYIQLQAFVRGHFCEMVMIRAGQVDVICYDRRQNIECFSQWNF